MACQVRLFTLSFSAAHILAQDTNLTVQPAQASEDADAKRLRQVALDGDAHAQFALGLMFETGESVSQDYAEAVHWYRLAAEHGEANAQFRLGLMFVNGTGVPREAQMRAQWWLEGFERRQR